jgi:hypothetical protein
MSTTKSPRRPAGSIKALAEALNITTRQVHNQLLAGMPDDVETALAWRGAGIASGDAGGEYSPEALRKQKILLTAQHVRLATVKADMESGKLIKLSNVLEGIRQAVNQTRSAFLRMPFELPARLAGLDEVAIKKLLRAEIHNTLEELSQNLNYPYESTDQKIEGIEG